MVPLDNQAKANGRIIIVLDLEVLEHLGESEKIGNPQALDPKTDDVQPQSTTIQTGGFYGTNAQVPQQQTIPQRSATNHSSTSHANIYPIEALSPYAHKWTIKARCTNKSDIKTWHNKNGEGKLFSVNLLDESGEIRGTGFNDQCDALYEVFQEGGVYYITSPCRVQMAKKQFTNLNNDYELTFERDTMVEKVSFKILLLGSGATCLPSVGRRAERSSASPLQLHQHWRPAVSRERYHYRHYWRSQRSWRDLSDCLENHKQTLRQARAHPSRQFQLLR